MRITLNNIAENIELGKDEITVQELLDYKNFSFKLLVVKINGILIKKGNYHSATIKHNDHVTVLHMISGG
jgi:sulfur carrier protein